MQWSYAFLALTHRSEIYWWLSGQSGRVVIDDNGDLEPDWALWYYSPDTDEIIKYMEFVIGVTNAYVSTWGKVIYQWLKLYSLVAHSIVNYNLMSCK